jgi:hypothetical protein
MPWRVETPMSQRRTSWKRGPGATGTRPSSAPVIGGGLGRDPVAKLAARAPRARGHRTRRLRAESATREAAMTRTVMLPR